MSQETSESKEPEPEKSDEETLTSEQFVELWKAVLLEQEANTNKRIRLLSELWQRNRKIKADQRVMNAYLLELLMSTTKDARELYQQSFITVETLEGILEGLDEVSRKVKGSDTRVQEIIENLKGKIGPLVQEQLESYRKRVAEESKKKANKIVV